MTQHEKEIQRKKMMWTALWAIIAVMFALICLVLIGKPVAELSMIASAFFTVLAGLNASSYFSKPTPGKEEKENNNGY